MAVPHLTLRLIAYGIAIPCAFIVLGMTAYLLRIRQDYGFYLRGYRSHPCDGYGTCLSNRLGDIVLPLFAACFTLVTLPAELIVATKATARGLFFVETVYVFILWALWLASGVYFAWWNWYECIEPALDTCPISRAASIFCFLVCLPLLLFFPMAFINACTYRPKVVSTTNTTTTSTTPVTQQYYQQGANNYQQGENNASAAYYSGAANASSPGHVQAYYPNGQAGNFNSGQQQQQAYYQPAVGTPTYQQAPYQQMPYQQPPTSPPSGPQPVVTTATTTHQPVQSGTAPLMPQNTAGHPLPEVHEYQRG